MSLFTVSTEKQAEIINELRRIERRNGVLTTHQVVEEAKGDLSPLHDLFEWDNDVAAEKYRLYQARQLISSLRVSVKGRETPLFFNVTVEMKKKKKQRGYISLDKVLSDEDVYNEVILKATGELRYWQNKYQTLKELRGVIDEKALAAAEVGAGIEVVAPEKVASAKA